MTSARTTPLSLYLIRHGETEWSLSGRHTGRTDIPLTATGEEQARGLIPCLARIQFARVLTSPRQRAQSTCALAGLGEQAEIEPDLAEWDYGEYEGKRSSDIRKDRPDWNVFQYGCPGGETPVDVSGRADRLISHLSTMEGNVALFSHGEFGPALAARWSGLPVIAARNLLIGTASVSILGYHPGHADLRVIALWDATPAFFANGACADARSPA